MNELIKIKQLPVIEQQLQKISKDIDKKIEEISKLEVNEETVKEVKKTRTGFNKDFTELENKRKEVKKAILTPYEQFEKIYKTYVTNKFTKANTDLKNKIDFIEQKIKDDKEKEVKEYFEEYKQANNIDFVEYKQVNIKVGLSDSLKSLKEQSKKAIDQIISDLELIDTQENKTEILVEYKQNLNASLSITSVKNRFKAIEQEKIRQEECQKQKEVEKQRIAQVENVVKKVETPIEIEKVYTTRFTVKATKSQLLELKKFLNDGGYIYE